MVDHLKKPSLLKSKSFSFGHTKGSFNERKQRNIIIHSDENIHYSPVKAWLGPPSHDDMYDKDGKLVEYHDDRTLPSARAHIQTFRKSGYDEFSDNKNISPPWTSCSLVEDTEGSNTARDTCAVRVSMKRKNSFIPSVLRSVSARPTHENDHVTSPVNVFRPTCPGLETDNENDDTATDRLAAVPHKRSTLFIPTALRAVSMSPKTMFRKPAVSSKKLKPPLVRTLSYCASSDTHISETDSSDQSPSASSTPTSSSSSSLHRQDDQSVEICLLDDTTVVVSVADTTATKISDLDKSSRSTLRRVTDEGCTSEANRGKMSLLRSWSLVTGMFLMHYIKCIGLTLNLKTIATKMWMTSFDVMVGAVSITVEVMSYAIPLVLRIFEISMLWIVQQVYIRRIFILFHETLKRRRKNHDIDGDVVDQPANELTLSPLEKNHRRTMRFLSVSKETVRRKSIRYKD